MVRACAHAYAVLVVVVLLVRSGPVPCRVTCGGCGERLPHVQLVDVLAVVTVPVVADTFENALAWTGVSCRLSPSEKANSRPRLRPLESPQQGKVAMVEGGGVGVGVCGGGSDTSDGDATGDDALSLLRNVCG